MKGDERKAGREGSTGHRGESKLEKRNARTEEK
jgi:hypothetical protein